jgi:hypothetical protein
MNQSMLDRWLVGLDTLLSRRAFGAGAALAALSGALDADGKKKKKKKRKKPSGICIEITQECSGSGCCPGLDCKLVFNLSVPLGPRCCRSAGECRFAADCCRGTYCSGGECLQCKGDGEACLSGQCCPGSICFTLVPTEPGTCIRSD